MPEYGPDFTTLDNKKKKSQIFIEIASYIIWGGFLIAMIVVGANNMNECSYNANIPIWLIVFATFGLFAASIMIIQNIIELSPDFIEDHPTFILCFAIVLKGVIWILFSLFQIIWLIIGSVWIYSARYKISNNSADSNYCSSSFYNFAFGSITAIWSLIGLSFILSCCLRLAGSRSE